MGIESTRQPRARACVRTHTTGAAGSVTRLIVFAHHLPGRGFLAGGSEGTQHIGAVDAGDSVWAEGKSLKTRSVSKMIQG